VYIQKKPAENLQCVISVSAHKFSCRTVPVSLVHVGGSMAASAILVAVAMVKNDKLLSTDLRCNHQELM